MRLKSSAPAYDLGSFLEQPALFRSVKQWSLTTLLGKMTEIGAPVVPRSRQVVSLLVGEESSLSATRTPAWNASGA